MSERPLKHGDWVRLIPDPTRAGFIDEPNKSKLGRMGVDELVQVRFPDGRISTFPYSVLELVPPAVESCFNLFTSGKLVNPDWLRRAIMRLRVSGRLKDIIYSMEATNTDFYPHQFKPVIKLMDSPTDSLLIADEVGLGKTIEAGLIWTELRARHDCDRLLVVCPKTLREKWVDELNNRFGVDAKLANAQELLNALRRTHEKGTGFALVSSMQALRPNKGWDQPDNQTQSARNKLANFLKEVGGNNPLIDLLIVDEAHHMRNPTTQQHKIGHSLNESARYRVFLTATPIHLGNQDLHSILKMVDPNTFEYPSTLYDLIESNEPIIAARDRLLGRGSGSEVKAILDRVKDHELLRESKTLDQILKQLNNEPIDRSKRAKLASRLERVNQLANYVNRTRRRDIELNRPRRVPVTPSLEMNGDEKKFYEQITTVVREYAKTKQTNELFLLSVPQRLLTSSMAAASQYWMSTINRDMVEESDDDLDESLEEHQPLRSKISKRANELQMTSDLKQNDTKFNHLKEKLEGYWKNCPDEKVILFSSFIPTLQYLHDRLNEQGIRSELLHGRVGEQRATILRRFQTDPHVRLLLSSEVGGEGIDLQFCSIIVNYDIPWNPMRLEQRVGRVDRIGQSKEKIQILNLVFDNTIDNRIYHRLYDRLMTAERSLGEFEAILGRKIRDLTIELLNPELTIQEQEEKIDQTAQAMESKYEEMKRLEEDAGSLVKHGDYILNQIYERRNNDHWLSGKDIRIYVRDRLENSYPGTKFESTAPGKDEYKIHLSSELFADFSNFLSRRKQEGGTRLLKSDARQRYSFTESIYQQVGYVEYISQFHPLVRFCVDLDRKDEANRQSQAVASVIERQDDSQKLKRGVFVIAISQWSSNRNIHDLNTNTQIGFVGKNVETGSPISADMAERIALRAMDGSTMVNSLNHPLFSEACKIVKMNLKPAVDDEFNTYRAQTRAEIEDRLNIQERALSRQFGKKQESLQLAKDSLRQQIEDAKRNGDSRLIQRLEALTKARDAELLATERVYWRKKKQIDQQRVSIPELNEIGVLFVEVRN